MMMREYLDKYYPAKSDLEQDQARRSIDIYQAFLRREKMTPELAEGLTQIQLFVEDGHDNVYEKFVELGGENKGASLEAVLKMKRNLKKIDGTCCYDLATSL
jgi:hypothetical protein